MGRATGFISFESISDARLLTVRRLLPIDYDNVCRKRTHQKTKVRNALPPL
jgi:hypothetical protein